ncbi:unnamed protein product, partial [Rangifer tarandus platyrhynchus]
MAPPHPAHHGSSRGGAVGNGIGAMDSAVQAWTPLEPIPVAVPKCLTVCLPGQNGGLTRLETILKEGM